MEINEVKIGDTVAFTHNKKKVMGKVIYRHDDSDNKKSERASLMGHVNVQIMDNNSYPVTVHVYKLKPAVQEEIQMEEHLDETVLDLIDHIDSGDNLAAEAALNNILQSRAAEVLDALKAEVASSMFNTEQCAECDEEQVDEALKGGQQKIDANKNSKIDAHDFKLLRAKKKGMKEEVELDEASYSAKKAPGKTFGKIAKKASRKYGKERGAKIAGAVLAKLRENVEMISEEEYDAYRDHHLERGTWDRERSRVRSGGTPNYGKYLTKTGQFKKKSPSSSASDTSGSHSVHIGGKKWKSFSSHGHATNVAKKLTAKGGKKEITVHKDD